MTTTNVEKIRTEKTRTEQATTEQTTIEQANRAMRPALYCRRTGRRLAPKDALGATEHEVLAVAVFDDGTSIGLTGDAVIGRQAQRDRRVTEGRAVAIVIDDPFRSISRSHVLLQISAEGVVVSDLGSQNGTAVRDEDGSWSPTTPGLARLVGDGQPIRLGTRTVSVFPTRRTGLSANSQV